MDSCPSPHGVLATEERSHKRPVSTAPAMLCARLFKQRLGACARFTVSDWLGRQVKAVHRGEYFAFVLVDCSSEEYLHDLCLDVPTAVNTVQSMSFLVAPLF